MAAISGPWSALVRRTIPAVEEFEDYIEWSSTRGRDFQCIATVIYYMEKLPGVTSHPGAQVVDKWLQRVTPPQKQFIDRVDKVFAVFGALVSNKKYTTAFSKPRKISPAEFIGAAILIDNHMGQLSLSQLSLGIVKMRQEVRKTYEDIRANSKVMKMMVNYILDRMPTNLKKDDPNEKPAQQVVKVSNVIEGASQKNGKRKRDVSSTDDDEDIPLSQTQSPIRKAPRAPSGVALSTKASRASPPPASTSNLKTKAAPKPPANASRSNSSANVSGPSSSQPGAKGPNSSTGDRLAKLREAQAASKFRKTSPSTNPYNASQRGPSRQTERSRDGFASASRPHSGNVSLDDANMEPIVDLLAKMPHTPNQLGAMGDANLSGGQNSVPQSQWPPEQRWPPSNAPATPTAGMHPVAVAASWAGAPQNPASQQTIPLQSQSSFPPPTIHGLPNRPFPTIDTTSLPRTSYGGGANTPTAPSPRDGYPTATQDPRPRPRSSSSYSGVPPHLPNGSSNPDGQQPLPTEPRALRTPMGPPPPAYAYTAGTSPTTRWGPPNDSTHTRRDDFRDASARTPYDRSGYDPNQWQNSDGR